MAADLNYCFSNTYEDVLSSSFQSTTNESLIFNLSILKEKAQHVHSIAAMFFSETQSQSMVPADPTSIDHMENIANLLQEIIAIASNVMFTCSQNNVVGPTTANPTSNMLEFGQMTQSHLMFDQWSHGGENSFGSVTCKTRNENISVLEKQKQKRTTTSSGGQRLSPGNYDIIEMDAAELLAKYTHYCQVCGKGFKRDANLRMHMRAHGDEYKSTAALANPVSLKGLARKYSCPQEGCRWNRKHAKFQPLKSMICMKNHYKRSHCPKLYACKRCHQKQFSVLSDLRTHEKHCGDVKWRCSCGTTFSRKDKLMGHVGLFVGHTPIIVDSSGSLIKSQ